RPERGRAGGGGGGDGLRRDGGRGADGERRAAAGRGAVQRVAFALPGRGAAGAGGRFPHGVRGLASDEGRANDGGGPTAYRRAGGRRPRRAGGGVAAADAVLSHIRRASILACSLATEQARMLALRMASRASPCLLPP